MPQSTQKGKEQAEEPPSSQNGNTTINPNTAITVAVPADRANNQPRSHRMYQILVILSGFTVTATACSLIFSFGVYQDLYEQMAQEPSNPFSGQSSSLIGLIGILGVSLMTMGGPFVTMWARLYPPQLVVAAGGIVIGVGFVLASISHALWEFAITQGILVGIGTSMAYVTTTSVAPTWFDKRRGLAMGIIVAGTGVGGMIWPPILRAIIDTLGFRDAMRVSGCITIGLICLAAGAMRWEPKFQEQARTQMQYNTPGSVAVKWPRGLQLPQIEWEVVKSNKFIAQAAANFIQATAYSVPLFYYAAFAQSLGYDASMADDFITISNASNFVSRIAIGWAADKFGRINALFITTAFSTIAVLAFWLSPTYLACSKDTDASCRNTKSDTLYILFVIFYGSFASAYISLFPASLLELFGQKHFSSVNGQLSLIRGMGALLGTPLISLLIPQAQSLVSPGAYQRATIVVAVLLFAASVLTLWVRIEATRGSIWKWKA